MVLPEPLSILDIKKADQTISLDGWLITGKPVIGHSIYSISAIKLKSNTKNGVDRIRTCGSKVTIPDHRIISPEPSTTQPPLRNLLGNSRVNRLISSFWNLAVLGGVDDSQARSFLNHPYCND